MHFEITGVETFHHPKFGDLLVLTDKQGEPWFLGKEIAETLGFTNPNKVIKDYISSEDRRVLKYKAMNETFKASQIWSGQDHSDKYIINESGLYTLLFGTELEKLVEFEPWLTSEVLPQIRCTCGYIPTDNANGEPITDIELNALACKILENIEAERNRKAEDVQNDEGDDDDEPYCLINVQFCV